MYAPTGVGDVGCPKCEAASGTPCLYVYNWMNSHKVNQWRKGRTGKPIYGYYHTERHAKYRELRDNTGLHRAQLRSWFFLHGDIFEERPNG